MTASDCAAPPLAIHLFGPFEVRVDGVPLPRLRSRKGEWLLALLVLRPGAVERTWLAGTLWPDSSEIHALASLRRTLTDLRQALGPEASRLRSPTPRTLDFDLAGMAVDVVGFDAAIARGDLPPLEKAVSLYRGPLLEECGEAWAFQERQAREQAYLRALETLAAHALAGGDPAAAERDLRQAVAVDPLRESAQRALMRVQAAGGNYAAALQTYRELRLLLHRELNAQPDPETKALFEQLGREAKGKAASSPVLAAKGKQARAMACSACGAVNPAAARFCSQCGAALPACPQCGHLSPRGSRFCQECGAPLIAPALAPHLASPEAYTPRPLAEKIRSSRAAMEGEHKLVTVLSTDVVGFTSLAEQLTAEECYDLIRQCVDRMLEPIHRYEGTVTQFLGDGLLALFGAPIAHEDHAQRGVRAALAVQESFRAFQGEVQESRGVQFQMRIGLNSGLVVVGTIGRDLSMTYTAIGDTVNLADRIQELAEPGTVVISEPTQRLVRGYFVTRDLGAHPVKGKEQAVTIYEVLRPSRQRSRVDVAVERGLNPFVGRERELEFLLERTADAQAGRGQIVFLRGEAGIGKSRLLYELRGRLENETHPWVEGRCISYGRDIAYLPVMDLLKASFDLQEIDSAEEIVRRVEVGTQGLGEDGTAGVPFLKHLLAVGSGDTAVTRMDAAMRKARIFDAVRDLWVARSRLRPLVLVVEDLHWIDPLSEELLSYIADAVPCERLLLLLTHRTEYVQRFGSSSHVTTVDLKTLSERETAAVAQGLMGAESMPAELRELIYRKAEGNPFFVEEVTRSLVEAGALRRSGSGDVVARPVEEINVPDTVQDVIMARLDRLPEEPKRALQTASVIGREFAVRLLERAAELQGRLDECLRELKAVELIHERSLYPERTYMFRHALTHEVAYNSLLVARRRVLHRRVGEAIEELYADRLAEYQETLAYHFEQARAWEKALEHLLESGEKALAAFAPRQAVSFYDRALAVLRKSGQALSPERGMSLYHQRGQAHLLAGSWDESVESFQAMLQSAEEARDQIHKGIALSQLCFACFYAHRLDEAKDHSERLWHLAGTTNHPVLLASSLAMRAAAHTYTDNLTDLQAARREAEEGLRIARQADVPFLQGAALQVQGFLDFWQGEYARALAHWDEALRIGRERQDPLPLFWGLWGQGLAACGQGEYELALRSLQEGREFTARLENWRIHGNILNTLGWVYIELCNWERAIQCNAAAAAEGRDRALPETIHNAELNLGDCYLALGQLDEARRHFENVHKPSVRGDVWEGCFCRYTQHLNASLGELWLARGDAARAMACAGACLAAAETTLSRRNIVKGRRLRGQALRVRGRRDEAERDLAVAVRIAREIGNPVQLWKTLAAIARLREDQDRLPEAVALDREALSVIEGVADGLSDPDLRATLLASPQVSALQADLARLSPGEERSRDPTRR
jgi:class 3 adenylate cyclase/DNA-binding SARP family transcriptional activator